MKLNRKKTTRLADDIYNGTEQIGGCRTEDIKNNTYKNGDCRADDIYNEVGVTI